MRSLLILALSGCSLMPSVPPHARSMPDMLKAAARIQVDCTMGDPFAQDECPQQPCVSHGNEFNISAGFGSAVITDERHMLTAWHVIKCPTFPTIYAFLSNGKRVSMLVDREDQQHDLARLRVISDERFHLDIPPPVFGKRPLPGETICSMVTTPSWHWSCGAVARSVAVPFDGRPRGSTFDIDATIDTQLGNSGAGAYGADGSLVGIVTGHCTDDSCAGVMSLDGRVP